MQRNPFVPDDVWHIVIPVAESVGCVVEPSWTAEQGECGCYMWTAHLVIPGRTVVPTLPVHRLECGYRGSQAGAWELVQYQISRGEIEQLDRLWAAPSAQGVNR
jgi:hypothetical protein